jgi:hypothetical protein
MEDGPFMLLLPFSSDKTWLHLKGYINSQSAVKLAKIFGGKITRDKYCQVYM